MIYLNRAEDCAFSLLQRPPLGMQAVDDEAALCVHPEPWTFETLDESWGQVRECLADKHHATDKALNP